MAVPRGGGEAVPLVAALVGKAVRDNACGYDGGREVPHVLENVRVDAMTDTDGVRLKQTK